MKYPLSSSPFIHPMNDEVTNKPKKHQEPLSVSIKSVHYFEDRVDKEIWHAFQQGQEEAFTFIYEHYFDTLYHYGCQLTQDTGLVEDMLQDFFVAFRLGKQKTSEVICIKAYLLKSFRRKMIRHLQKKKRLVFNEEVTEGNFKIFFHHDMPFMKMQFHQEQQKYIAQMLNKLTPREREAIYYFYFENLDYKSISQVMELSSAKSARNLIYKALSGLKKNKHLFPDWLHYSMLLLWL